MMMPRGNKNWVKGRSANPAGRPSGHKPVAQKMVIWNLREAARRYGEKSLDAVVECLDSDDERVRLAAAAEILNRGWGKAKEMVDVTMTHSFAEVPQVMQLDQWLETKGQPQLLPPKADDDDPRNKSGGKLN